MGYGILWLIAIAAILLETPGDCSSLDSWTLASAVEENSWQGVTYGNGKFVAVASDGTNRVMQNSDGVSWTAASAALDFYGNGNSVNQVLNTIAHGNGKFVDSAQSGKATYGRRKLDKWHYKCRHV